MSVVDGDAKTQRAASRARSFIGFLTRSRSTHESRIEQTCKSIIEVEEASESDCEMVPVEATMHESVPQTPARLDEEVNNEKLELEAPDCRTETPLSMPKAAIGQFCWIPESIPQIPAKLGEEISNEKLEPAGTKAPDCRTETPPSMPKATIGQFCWFLQCQLKKEAQVLMNADIDLDRHASDMWNDYEDFVKPNLGNNERWVPYHTILGVHEKFLVESVHHSQHKWDNYQKFLAMFVFRAHCKADVFNVVQLPILKTARFWRNPKAAFEPNGAMEKALRKYRQLTRKPLLTSCFRCIPKRVLANNDDNLIRSIILRTGRLIDAAIATYPVVMDRQKCAHEKFSEISTTLQAVEGLGPTWAKMLMCCIDIAYPSMGLLASDCDVGIGAIGPLRRLLPGGGHDDPHQALAELQSSFNESEDASFLHFWTMLAGVEAIARNKFSKYPLILGQMTTTSRNLSAATLQVQLCEFRQFRHSLARKRYNLKAGDESMKEPPKSAWGGVPKQVCTIPITKQSDRGKSESSLCKSKNDAKTHTNCASGSSDKRALPSPTDKQQAKDLFPENSTRWTQRCNGLHCDEEKRLVSFVFTPLDVAAEPIIFNTSVDVVGNWKLAERVSLLCHSCLQEGSPVADVEEFRDELSSQCFRARDAEDVEQESPAWGLCKISLKRKKPLVHFAFQVGGEKPEKISFQTTSEAAGSYMEAERIARLCYQKFQKGASQKEVLEFRDALYKAATRESGEVIQPVLACASVTPAPFEVAERCQGRASSYVTDVDVGEPVRKRARWVLNVLRKDAGSILE